MQVLLSIPTEDGTRVVKYVNISDKVDLPNKLRFTPCKALQPQQGMGIQVKETQKD